MSLWQVTLSRQASKQFFKLPDAIVKIARTLLQDLTTDGPLQNEWRNFGKLRGKINTYHCHIKSGKPTYVVCWEIKDKKIQIIEVYYVGTHEKAPY